MESFQQRCKTLRRSSAIAVFPRKRRANRRRGDRNTKSSHRPHPNNDLAFCSRRPKTGGIPETVVWRILLPEGPSTQLLWYKVPDTTHSVAFRASHHLFWYFNPLGMFCGLLGPYVSLLVDLGLRFENLVFFRPGMCRTHHK